MMARTVSTTSPGPASGQDYHVVRCVFSESIICAWEKSTRRAAQMKRGRGGKRRARDSALSVLEIFIPHTTMPTALILQQRQRGGQQSKI